MQQPIEVLVVDQDPKECEFITLAAQAEWPTVGVVCVNSEADAWFRLVQDVPLPDLVLLGPVLFPSTSIGFLQKLKNRTRYQEIPVLILSTLTSEADISNYYQAGATAFLFKPTGLAEYRTLLALIRTMWLNELGDDKARFPLNGHNGTINN